MTPREILSTMLQRDRFSKWLGLEIETIETGYCKLHYTVTNEMLNGFESIHGGVLFAASDSAFAFACNTHGIMSVALEASIHFLQPAKEGEPLYVEAKEIHLANKTGLYEIRTTNASGQLIALFNGTAYRTGKEISR